MRRTSIAPDAEVAVRSFLQAGDQRARQQLQEQAEASALERMLTETGLKHELAVQDEIRQGEEGLGAINEFLRTNTPIAERLGRVTYQPPAPTEDEAAAFEGGRRGAAVYQSYDVKGRGAKTLSDFLTKEISNVSAENRATAQAEAAQARLLATLGSRENIAANREAGLNLRQGNALDYDARKTDLLEAGRDRRFTTGEAGKTARNNTMAGAIAGETTLRTQIAAMDEYVKGLQAQMTQARMQFFMAPDPMAKAQAAASMQALQQEIDAALAQQKQLLQPRTPSVTQPTTPPVKEKTVIRGPDGKLIVK